MIITKATEDDLPFVGEIFLKAFFSSVKHLFKGEKPNNISAGDIFKVFLLFERDCFYVAKLDNRVAGYIVATKDIREIWVKTLLSGVWLRWFFRWVKGDYGFGIKPIYNLLKNKLLFVRDEKRETDNKDYGRVLSIAVDENYQGHGIGKELVKKGLAYLKSQGKDYVKLEVRPSNIPAVKAYTTLGFDVIGKMEDLQGEWIIMLKKL